MRFFFSDSYPVIPTGVAGFFVRAVRGAPATKRRDRGNQSPVPPLEEITSRLLLPAICSLLSVIQILLSACRYLLTLFPQTPGAFSSNSSATSRNTRAGTLKCTTSPSPLTASICNFPFTIATRT